MPAPTPLTYRCRRDWKCDGREPQYDDTGALTGWQAGRPTRGQADGLCATCEGRLEGALAVMPQLLLELNQRVGADATAAPLDPQPRSGSKHPPIPLRVDVEAVRALLVHEALLWADHLGHALDAITYRDPTRPLPWGWPYHGRGLDERVVLALHWLRPRWRELIALGTVTHSIASVGYDPADRLDPDTVRVLGTRLTGGGPNVVADLDGIDAACSFLDLRRRADQMTGNSAVRHRSPVGCVRCGWAELERGPGEDWWRCRNCRHETRSDDHDVLRDALLHSRPATTQAAHRPALQPA